MGVWYYRRWGHLKSGLGRPSGPPGQERGNKGGGKGPGRGRGRPGRGGGGPVGPALIFEDTFTEATNTSFAAHTPDIGTGWSEDFGNWTVTASTDRGGTANTVSGNNRYRVSITDSIGDDHSVEFESYKPNIIGPICRYTHIGASNGCTGYFLQRDFGTNTLSIYRFDNGSSTQLDSVAGFPFVSGEKLKIEAVGSTIKAYYDDVEVLSVVDGTYASGGAAIRCQNNEQSVVDNFKVFVL